MNLLTIFVTLGFSLSWGASPANKPFETIQKWHNDSKPVLFSELSGKIIQGKCFSLFSPERPESDTLVVMSRPVGDDRGPGFPVEIERKAAIVIYREPVTKEQYINQVKAEWSIFTHVIPSDESIVEWKQNDISGEIRKSEKYYTSLVRLDVNYTCTQDYENLCKKGEVLPKGKITEACYFYDTQKQAESPNL